MYSRCRIGKQQWQSTDIHLRASKGTGSFNWRHKFKVTLPLRGEARAHSYLSFQVWDKDLISDDLLVSHDINLASKLQQAFETLRPVNAFETPAKLKKGCTVELREGLREKNGFLAREKAHVIDVKYALDDEGKTIKLQGREVIKSVRLKNLVELDGDFLPEDLQLVLNDSSKSKKIMKDVTRTFAKASNQCCSLCCFQVLEQIGRRRQR